MTPNWIRSSLTRNRSPHGSRSPVRERRRSRPALEILEDRIVMSGGLDPSLGSEGKMTTDFYPDNKTAQP